MYIAQVLMMVVRAASTALTQAVVCFALNRVAMGWARRRVVVEIPACFSGACHSVRTDFARDLKVALRLETGHVVLGESLLQGFDLRLEHPDVLKVLVLLGDLGAQLVVDLPLMVIDYVRVLLVEEDSRLPGGQE